MEIELEVGDEIVVKWRDLSSAAPPGMIAWDPDGKSGLIRIKQTTPSVMADIFYVHDWDTRRQDEKMLKADYVVQYPRTMIGLIKDGTFSLRKPCRDAKTEKPCNHNFIWSQYSKTNWCTLCGIHK